jgi:hypothetical protein
MLQAVDSNEVIVGDWEITGNGEDNSYQKAPNCEQSLVHNNAEIKPFRSHFMYKAPPAGTGNVTFYALIKVGTANDGWFYFPNGLDKISGSQSPVGGYPGRGVDLVLMEGANRTHPWFAGEAGQSCNQACAGRGQQCDADALMIPATTATPGGIQDAIGDTVACPLPLKPTCHGVAPAKSRDGNCWYNVANDDRKKSSLCPYMNTNPVGKETVCDVARDNAERFCKCKGGSNRGAHSFFSFNKNLPEVKEMGNRITEGYSNTAEGNDLLGLIKASFYGRNSIAMITVALGTVALLFIGSWSLKMFD